MKGHFPPRSSLFNLATERGGWPVQCVLLPPFNSALQALTEGGPRPTKRHLVDDLPGGHYNSSSILQELYTFLAMLLDSFPSFHPRHWLVSPLDSHISLWAACSPALPTTGSGLIPRTKSSTWELIATPLLITNQTQQAPTRHCSSIYR
jgi:hypothetical protein